MRHVAREIAVCHNPHNSSGSSFIQSRLERVGAPSKDGPDEDCQLQGDLGLGRKG